MKVTFYYNQSDSRVINKTLTEGSTLSGELKSESSVMTPEILFDNDEVLRYNYCYIHEFQRYYSIENVTSVRTGLWNVSMSCDVLMSFRGDILNLRAVVSKQTLSEIGDEYIDDKSLVAENQLFSTVYNFDNGFNDEGTYILITAG